MLHNLSAWHAIVVENWLADAQKCQTLVVKQSFEFDDNGRVYAMQTSEDIVMADEMVAEPTTSSLLEANETVAFKAGFELYGNITAYPPKAKQAKVIEVNLSLKSDNDAIFSKTLRVTGKRVWQSSLLGSKASDPLALAPTSLSYENTYGGIDAEKPEKMKVFEENPAGIGFRIKKSSGQALPAVEYPKHYIKHPKKQVPPASFGAVAQFWQPRLSLLPEIDQTALMANEYPYKGHLPENTFNYAPQDQQLAIAFNNKLTLSLKGVMPNKSYHDIVQVKLPYIPPSVVLVQGEQQEYVNLTCDTLVIDTDANAFHLLWRKSIKTSDLNAYSKLIVLPTEQPTEQEQVA